MPRFSITAILLVMTGVAFLAASVSGLSPLGNLLTGFGLFAVYLGLCLHHTRRIRRAANYRGKHRQAPF